MFIEIIYTDGREEIIQVYDTFDMVDSKYIHITNGANQMIIPLCNFQSCSELEDEFLVDISGGVKVKYNE